MKDERDIEKEYSTSEFVSKLRRLADSLETGEKFEIQIAGERIYVPEKYRFFLPELDRDFILITDVGNVKTHLTSNGYFTKGLRQWFYVNGPIMPNDKLVFTIIDEHTSQYQMEYIKCKK